MRNLKPVAWALVAVGLGWLAIMTLFVMSGLHSGKVNDSAAAILGIGLFGGIPALMLWAGAGVLFARARGEAGALQSLALEQALFERVQTRGRCDFDELSRELDARPSEVEAAIYALVGKQLFTGYVNWRGREIVSAEAVHISGQQCPNCGGTIELAGKGMARCSHCGTETYLPGNENAR